jgi:hypothetical protein
VPSAPTLPQDPGSQARVLLFLAAAIDSVGRMITPRHFGPLLFTLVVAYTYAGPLFRLYLLFTFIAKPAIILASAGLLLFVIRSSDICGMLQIDLSAWWIRCFVAATRHLPHGREQSDPVPTGTPSLTPLFQRPPPRIAL